MTKRATLSLSPEESTTKKQASDLKSTSNNEPAVRSTPPKSAKASTDSSGSESRERSSIPQPNRGVPESQRVVKMILLVAAAVLSLYLLRRRFY